MSNEVLVKVEHVSKKFCKDLKTSLWYGLKDLGSELIGQNYQKELRNKEFWAVNDVSFELKRGECLGLIGHNGAGKSTLLKMLNGLIKPDSGSISMKGRIGALIELGAGFNHLLTGRENVFINGQILGFTKKEIAQKFDAIVEFAEMQEFIDTPVQNYSSGMKVRLGFAIAAQLEPDILIIDEVLAVGDMGFILKCFRTIDNLLSKTAIIFVSHSMPQISRISTNLLLMKNGKETFSGKDISGGIDLYYKDFSFGITNFSLSQEVILQKVSFPNTPTNELHSISRLDNLIVNFTFIAKKTFLKLYPTVIIYDKEQRPIGICLESTAVTYNNIYDKEYNEYQISLLIPKINLSKGIYFITLAISENYRSKHLVRLQSIASFQVLSTEAVWEAIHFQSEWANEILNH